jgi:hypothetical protein
MVAGMKSLFKSDLRAAAAVRPLALALKPVLACLVTLGLTLGIANGGFAEARASKPTPKPNPTAAVGSLKSVGLGGQVLVATAAVDVIDGQTVTVSGKGYSTKVGIYVTYCVLPAAGQRPDLCGPFDITGASNSSTWISSNPPIYAKPLVKPFGKGGTFKVKLALTKMIGDQDCAQVVCAITTRADHTLGADRSADVFIPVRFKP